MSQWIWVAVYAVIFAYLLVLAFSLYKLGVFLRPDIRGKHTRRSLR